MSRFILNFKTELDITRFSIMYSDYELNINHKSISINNIYPGEITKIIENCKLHNIEITYSMEHITGI